MSHAHRWVGLAEGYAWCRDCEILLPPPVHLGALRDCSLCPSPLSATCSRCRDAACPSCDRWPDGKILCLRCADPGAP